MGIVNRKNITLGLAAWRLSKALKRLLHQAEPEPPPKRRRGAKVGAALAAALAVAGAVVFWRTRGGAETRPGVSTRRDG
jgi:ferric-dicitrate binding protein FerR (iron transport regulator)